MASQSSSKKRKASRGKARQQQVAAELPEPAQQAAGAGGLSLQSDLLQDKKRVRSDARLAARAVREQWDVSPRNRAELVSRLMRIVRKKHVMRPTADGGVGPDEGYADSLAISAGKVIVQMVAQNQRQQPTGGSQGTTINVGVNVDNRVDERRNRTLAIAQRFGAGRVLCEPQS